MGSHVTRPAEHRTWVPGLHLCLHQGCPAVSESLAAGNRFQCLVWPPCQEASSEWDSHAWSQIPFRRPISYRS